jgi:hypothetical protein
MALGAIIKHGCTSHIAYLHLIVERRSRVHRLTVVYMQWAVTD